MHPTADTQDFIFDNLAGRRVIGGVRCFYYMRKQLNLIALLILLPAASLSQEASPAEKYRSTKEYRNTLSVFRETPIAPAANPGTEMYRIFIVPTFSHPLSIRVERSGVDYVLVAKRLSGQGGYGWGTLKDEKRRRLSEREWRGLLKLLDETSFWTLPTGDARFEPNERGEVMICLDGTSWILEGVRGAKYHVVDRYCPELKGVREAGLYMVKLTKWGIKESDL